MSAITTKDGTEIYYRDWGTGPVVTFSRGWPLNADACYSSCSTATAASRTIAGAMAAPARLQPTTTFMAMPTISRP